MKPYGLGKAAKLCSCQLCKNRLRTNRARQRERDRRLVEEQTQPPTPLEKPLAEDPYRV